MSDRQQSDASHSPTPASNSGVQIVDPVEVEAIEDTPDVIRQPMFQTEEVVRVQSQIAGGTISGWHHHGDRHVFGYVLKGSGRIEYGPGGAERIEGAAPSFFHVPPGVVHRDINPTDDDMVVIVCFVGQGPVVVNVDGPEAA